MNPDPAVDMALTERCDEIEIARQYQRVSANSNLTSILETMPHIILILNRCRQIVWANHRLLTILQKENLDDIIGLRPGEVFGCVNGLCAEHGCGTANECQTCGALLAILQSMVDKGCEKECTILTTNNEAIMVLVKADLIEIDGEVFNSVSIVDISGEKNKRMLERLFFHDIMNLAGSIQGFADLLPGMIQKEADQVREILPVLSQGASDLIDLIKSQKDILSAENNELTVYRITLDAYNLLRDIRSLLERNKLLHGRRIEIQETPEKIHFSSDVRILKRVITNAVKNALEAIREGERVDLRYKSENDCVVFEVHNDSYIPENVQNHIFQKSFSTKGQDRGIGTYSIKLFTEKYLGGKVWFVSGKEEGTTFYIQIPVQ